MVSGDCRFAFQPRAAKCVAIEKRHPALVLSFFTSMVLAPGRRFLKCGSASLSCANRNKVRKFRSDIQVRELLLRYWITIWAFAWLCYCFSLIKSELELVDFFVALALAKMLGLPTPPLAKHLKCASSFNLPLAGFIFFEQLNLGTSPFLSKILIAP